MPEDDLPPLPYGGAGLIGDDPSQDDLPQEPGSAVEDESEAA
ncbi:hypothetical protein [Spongiactinospora sp. TRM90649]|nr:hypothetical protein [Spongiactinospora sp. TRM90649]MDF5756673.1 hypothetical protein [Spongiactinospora sp. TRM90649]